ncbi:MAG TPA: cytochrome P450 [Streptosporangiaceae bacterium]
MISDHAAVPPPFAQTGPDGEWIASRYADVQAILADERFVVAQADAGGEVGTLAWLRASVSRFANGAEHRRRRARAVAELHQLSPDELGRLAYERARETLAAEGGDGASIEVMSRLARRIPMAAMAEGLGMGRPQDAAAAVIEIAAAYFPGADDQAQRRADAATARLVGLLSPAPIETTVARIALMVQGCDATAGLIGSALVLLRSIPEEEATGWPTRALLDEVLRHVPPVRASRRVARQAAEVNGRLVPAGATVVCRFEAANLDPAAYQQPEHPTAYGHVLPSLTFGYGIRPCPGPPQALALAMGVVSSVRESCVIQGPREIGYEPSAALRVPLRVEVALR